jgi:hypothetical protein
MPRTDLPSPSSGCTNRPTFPSRKCRLNVPPQDRQQCTKKHGVTPKKTVCINTPVRTSNLVNRTFSHSWSYRVSPTSASWPDKVVPRLLPSSCPNCSGEVRLADNTAIDRYSYSRRCWTSSTSSASQEIPNILRTPKYYHVHRNSPPVPLLSHINTVRAVSPHLAYILLLPHLHTDCKGVSFTPASPLNLCRPTHFSFPSDCLMPYTIHEAANYAIFCGLC